MSKVLIMPPGAESGSVSHGKDQYSPWRLDIHDPISPWLVEVTDDAADHFCLKGGFQVYEQPPMRRRLSGQYVPIIHGDGSSPCAVSWEGDTYASECGELEDGTQMHVIAFPAEGVADVVGIHPGYAVLSLSDYQGPPVHPGKGYEVGERHRRLSLKKPPLQGGAVLQDIFPSNVKRGQHPDGVKNPEREAEILAAEAETEAREAAADEPEDEKAETKAEKARPAKSEKAKS